MWQALLVLLQFVVFAGASKLGYNTSGLNDQTWDNSDWIESTCFSEPFNFAENNNVPDLTQFYANYTQKHHAEISSEPGQGGELRFVGMQLFGQSNFECSIIHGFCDPMPKCSDIARHMSLDQKERQSEENVEELKRRYFLAKTLNEQMKFFNDIYVALDDSKLDLSYALSDITRTFATQPDAKAMRKCQRARMIEMSVVSTIAVVVCATTSVIPFGGPLIGSFETEGVRMISPAAEQFSDANYKFWLQQVGNSGFAFGPWVNNVAMFSPTLPQTWATEGIPTLLDKGVCSDTMGDFSDDTALIERFLQKPVADMMDMTRNAMLQHVQSRFSNSTFLPNGQSTLSAELDKYGWRLPLIYKDTLQEMLRKHITDNAMEAILGMMWRSEQCFIKCLPLDPGNEFSSNAVDLHNISGVDIIGDETNKLALSTFYPEFVLAGTKSTTNSSDMPNNIKPRHQCQTECLRQSQEAEPLFPDNILKVQNFSSAHFDPHVLFTSAVTSYISQVNGINEKKDDMVLISPPFFLPICISNALQLDDTLKEPKGRPETGWWNWHPSVLEPFKPVNYFPFHCGDWKASETKQFLAASPVGPNSPNYDSLDEFYYWNMKKSLTQLWKRPVTHFLTLCGADHRIGHKGTKSKILTALALNDPENHFIKGSEPVCGNFTEQITNMTELEATFWFCNGPQTEELLSWEIGADAWLGFIGRSDFKVPTHLDLCKSMRKEEKPFGLSPEVFASLEADYKSQLEPWKEQHQDVIGVWKSLGNPDKKWKGSAYNGTIPVFRWIPKDDTSKTPSVWSWPPVAYTVNTTVHSNQSSTL